MRVRMSWASHIENPASLVRRLQHITLTLAVAVVSHQKGQDLTEERSVPVQ